MTLEYLHVLSYLYQLPKRLPLRNFFKVFLSFYPQDNLVDMYVLIILLQSVLLTLVNVVSSLQISW